MSETEQEFDSRPLVEGLHELAGQAAAAPGLFEAVAVGARRRRARVRAASGAVLAVGGVLAVAGGAAVWPSSGAGGQAATMAATHSIAPVRCPADSPRGPHGKGPADRLFTGTPAAATLCIYGVTVNGIVLHPESIGGSDLAKLTRDLAHAKSSTNATCTLELINPEHLLVLQYADGSTQELVINMSGCGTVENGSRSVLLPNGLRQRITAG